MDASLYKEALRVMKIFYKHPISRSFMHISEIFDDTTNITNPLDLKTIEKKLRNKEYKTFNEWSSDIETMWSNAETYSNDVIVTNMAIGCRKIFLKIKRNFDVLLLPEWRKEVYRLRTRVYDLMGQPPARVKQYASSLGAASTMKQNMPPLTEKEIHAFISASEMMTPEDNAEMLKIIDEMQPEIDTGNMELFLDVSKINVQTIYALREYMKLALEERGEKYQD